VKPKDLFWGSQSTVKKLFAIAFTCVYLTLAVGVVRTTHYCLGRVKSSSLFSFETAKCPCYLFARSVNNKCCADEHEIIKIEDDHSASTVVSVAAEFFEIGLLFESIQLTNNAVVHVNQQVEESPPPLSDIPLFTKHCSLIFYDADMIA
jgi:hypothetical protein